ncbi:MAG: hypothetical protein LBI05_11265 [Planctomycetaceae bacterium]|jgi:hypothetical protein|nr:hypothetical protein [Planctomycetaceae bacterium]
MIRTIIITLLMLLPAGSVPGTTVLRLHDGGVVEGELLNPDDINRKLYRIKTAEGFEISLDAPLVERIQGRERDAVIEYNRDAPVTPHTVENHIHWAKWCNEQQLPDQAKVHWQQILEIDPDHADARKILGYTKTPNGWESKQDQRLVRGLVFDKGRWKTPQQIEVENILDSRKKEADDWQRTIRDIYRRRADDELWNIRHPAAFVPIRDILTDRNNPPPPQRRMMLLRILMQIPDDRAIQLVAGWSIRPDEPSEEIRRMCVEELQRQIPERPAIRSIMIAVYRSALNPKNDPAIIQLAVKALEEINGYEAVPELINVLVVARTETAPSQGGDTYTFGSQGTSLSQGVKPLTRTVLIPNQAVLSALCRLTGVNFEFNQNAWREWYKRSLRSPSLNLRRE